jgi:hypothetical protein
MRAWVPTLKDVQTLRQNDKPKNQHHEGQVFGRLSPGEKPFLIAS